jgi:hypothetical protein
MHQTGQFFLLLLGLLTLPLLASTPCTILPETVALAYGLVQKYYGVKNQHPLLCDGFGALQRTTTS